MRRTQVKRVWVLLEGMGTKWKNGLTKLKRLRDMGVSWLTKLFNEIILNRKMPDD